MNSSYNEIWKVVLDSFSKRYSEEVMNLWFNRLELVFLDDNFAFLTIDDPNFINLLNKRYAGQISEVLGGVLGFEIDVRIFDKSSYSQEKALASVSSQKSPSTEIKPSETASEIKNTDEFYVDKQPQETADVPDSLYTFENFIVGSSNKFAYAASVAVAKHPSAENNPLFIYGSSGLGKTHLMKAIANAVSDKNPNYKIIFVSGENFTNEYLNSLVNKATARFREKYRSVDLLFVDDIQFIAGKDSTQEEFFHTFYALYEARKQIVLTSDRPPHELKGLDERLVSRFEGGMVADIQPPDTELRIAIFKSKAMAMKVDLSNEVLTYIAENTKSNVRQIEGVIKRLGAYSFINGTPITVDIAKILLSGIISGSVPPGVIAEKVIDSVSARYNIPAEDIKGKRRSKEIAQARHIAIYVINHVTTLTLESIGNIVGRDHSTVLSSINVVSQQMKRDSDFEHEINLIIKEFS